MTLTLLRKAASTAAYSSLSECDRRRVANHMTHKPETAYKAYAAKNKSSDATSSVRQMKGIMYEGEGSKDGAVVEEESAHGECENDVYD